MNKSVQWANV